MANDLGNWLATKRRGFCASKKPDAFCRSSCSVLLDLVAPTSLWATTLGLQECRHQRWFAARLASKPGTGTDSATEAPLFSRKPSPLGLLLSQATTEPFCGKGFFGAGEGEPPLLQSLGEPPCSALGK